MFDLVIEQYYQDKEEELKLALETCQKFGQSVMRTNGKGFFTYHFAYGDFLNWNGHTIIELKANEKFENEHEAQAAAFDFFLKLIEERMQSLVS